MILGLSVPKPHLTVRSAREAADHREDQELSFLGRRELLENKRASGRPRGLADIALLEEMGTTAGLAAQATSHPENSSSPGGSMK